MDDWLEDDPPNLPSTHSSDIEYTRLSQVHTDSGYREGISRGKLQTLQTGFNTSFANVSPLAREVGHLRGVAAGVLGVLVKLEGDGRVERAREVVVELGKVGLGGFGEVRDWEAEAHAQEHANGAAGIDGVVDRRTEGDTEMEALTLPNGLREKKEVDDLTDAMEGLGKGRKRVEVEVDARVKLEELRMIVRGLFESLGLPPGLVGVARS